MNLKRKVAVVLLLLILVLSVACGESGENSGQGGGQGQGNGILAMVGDRAINEAELEQFVYFYGYTQGLDLKNFDEENMNYVRELILEEYINIFLVVNEFEDRGFELPQEATDEADDFVKQVGENEMASSYMEEYNVSDEFIKELYINQYYSQLYYEEIEELLPEITEDEAQKYYDDNPDYFIVDEVEARHILVESKKLGEEILKELEAGADFEELAKEHSTCPSGEEGGYLGTFTRGQMVPEFDEVAFELEAGERSGLVETTFGFHIIESIARKNEVESFEAIKAEISEFLKHDNIRKEYSDRIEVLREEYEIEYMK